MMNKLTSYFFIFILFGYFLGCSNSASLSKNDYTYLYDQTQKLINPEFKLFHDQEDSSTLYFQLKSNDILYGRINDSLLVANIWVKYYLWANKSRTEVIDSATHKLTNYGLNENKKIIQGAVRIKIPLGKAYPLEVRFRDENKGLNVIYEIVADKRFNGNSQFYQLRNGKQVLVEPIITHKGNTVLEKSPLITNNKYRLQQVNYSYSMTPPPFVGENNDAINSQDDTTSVVEFFADTLLISSFRNINQLLPVTKSDAFPVYFFYFYEGFPFVNNVEQMIQPIRYISTTSEYKKVNDATNKKGAMDNFWLKMAKNEEKAKKLIKEYYNRVEDANKYFSTYKEGWKTDRGIIYVVYGNPTTIYKTTAKETWIYGEENNILSIKFEFINVNNPQSANDYKLIRNADYKNNWYRAVDLWRQGKIL